MANVRLLQFYGFPFNSQGSTAGSGPYYVATTCVCLGRLVLVIDSRWFANELCRDMKKGHVDNDQSVYKLWKRIYEN